MITKGDSSKNDKKHSIILWILVGGMFFLRIPFLAGIRTFAPAAETWAAPVFEIGTYLLTSLAIWWERRNLADFHINRLALWIIIIGKPLELLLDRLNLPFEYPTKSRAYYLYLPISAALALALITDHFTRRKGTPEETPGLENTPSTKRLSLRAKRNNLIDNNETASFAGDESLRNVRRVWLWPLIGIFTGAVLGIIIGMLARTQGSGADFIYSNAPLSALFKVPLKVLIFLPLQQMLYAGIAEEPFFRGFLWGALRKAGWKETLIWLTQSSLFWLAHFYYIGKSPWSTWLIVPLGGLMLGWLAWRSRSIATSMLAHGCYNGFGQIVMFYLRR